MLSEVRDALIRYQRALKVMPFQPLVAESIAQFYEALTSLISSSSSLRPDFPLSKEVIDVLPKPLRGLAQQVRLTFSTNGNDAPDTDAELEALALLLTTLPHHLPETALLTRAVEEVKYRRGVRLAPPLLRLSWQPSLDLTLLEESQSDKKPQQVVTHANLLIINEGETPAQATRLRLSAEQHASIFSCFLSAPGTHGATQVNPPNNEVAIEIGSLPPSSSTLVFVELAGQPASSVLAEISGTYGKTDQTNRIDSTLKLSYPLTRKQNLAVNPYFPDLPLYPGVPWPGELPGDHQSIADSIRLHLVNATHYMFVIRGIRRTGKTSILFTLRESLHGSTQYCPVYIDLYGWHVELEEKNLPLDEEGLLYEIADAALQELMESSDKAAELLRPYASDLRMPIACFIELIEKGERLCGKKVVLLIDEFDWWTARDTFRPTAFLSAISGMGAARRLRAVFSYDWTTPEWDREPIIIPYRVEFLSECQLGSLISVAPHAFTTYASAFLWKLTGGWEGLAQLVLHSVCEQNDPSLITKGEIQSALAKLIVASDWQHFLEYLLRSLTPNEIGVLKEFVTAERIDLVSGEINGVELRPGKLFSVDGISDARKHTALAGLLKKQIIDCLFESSTRVRLRVGILAYPSVLELYTISDVAYGSN